MATSSVDKDRKSENRLQERTKILIEAAASTSDNENWTQKINEYNQERTNINDYL